MPLDNEHMKFWISIIESYSGIKPLRKNAQLKNFCGMRKAFWCRKFSLPFSKRNPQTTTKCGAIHFFGTIDAADETIYPPARDELSEPPMKKIRLSYVITHDQFHSKTFQKFVI